MRHLFRKGGTYEIPTTDIKAYGVTVSRDGLMVAARGRLCMFKPKRLTGGKRTDCTGFHDVLAEQVRPWLAKPDYLNVTRTRNFDGGVGQRIPSGTEAPALNKVRMYGGNLYLLAVIE